MEKSTWVYRSGDIFLPPQIVKFLHTYIVGNDSSQYYINLWHGMHLLSGIFFGLFQLFVYRFQHPYAVYGVIHTLWEIWQLSIGMTIPNLRGAIDVLNDTVIGFLGLLLVLVVVV